MQASDPGQHNPLHSRGQSTMEASMHAASHKLWRLSNIDSDPKNDYS